MAVPTVQSKGWILALFIRDDNERFLLGSGAYEFKEQQQQQHENEAYNYSYDLATRISEAQNYEEFKAAYDEIKAYEEAFRTQIGGDSYYIFLEESNYILNEI